MPITALSRNAHSLADVVHALGDIPLERIRFPAGNGTESDVIQFLGDADKRIYELIDGVLVEKPMGYRESVLAKYIGRLIDEFAEAHDLGIVTGADGPYRLRPGHIRFPDTSFVSWKQFPGGEVPADAICDAVPELVVEVISEGNTDDEMERKLKDYFSAGIKLVWYVYPKTKTALVFTSPTRHKELGIDDSLEGGRVVPGFSLPLKRVFGHLTRRKKQ